LFDVCLIFVLIVDRRVQPALIGAAFLEILDLDYPHPPKLCDPSPPHTRSQI
jgi:hypothetical protein